MTLDPSILALLRTRGDRLPNRAYKLMDGYGMDASLGESEVCEGDMSVTFPFADGKRRDGVGDLLEISGINTSRHVKNPVVLLDHGKYVQLPVALAEDPHTHQYTVTLDPIGQVATVKAYFYQNHADTAHGVLCEQIFDLMARRFLRAGSIGYQVIAAKELGPNYEAGIPKGLHLLSVLMLEASVVVMPANADTVRKALAMPRICGKPMSPMLVKSLSPYLPERKAVVAVPKSMPSDDISPEKARQILHDGEVNGHPLTEDQRRMFGAAASKKGVKVPLANLPDTKIPPPTWKPGVGAKKDFNAIRQKYRSGKGLHRKMRKSSAGSSVVYVRNKDLEATKKLATERGLTASHLGPHKSVGGLERVKLVGDDAAIEGVAKRYGRRVTKNTGIKSMPDAKKKDITREQLDDVDTGEGLGDEVPGQETIDQEVTSEEAQADPSEEGLQRKDMPEEKLSAQFLRRAHQDHRLLLQDYDSIINLMEHEPISKWAMKRMEGIEGTLSEIEDLFAEHHKDLPPLEGVENMGGEDKDLETPETEEEDTDPVPTDSKPKEEVPEEEAVEGMGIKSLTPEEEKTLRNKYKKGAAKCMKEPNVGEPGPCPGEAPNAKPKPKPQPMKPKDKDPRQTVGKKCMDCGKPDCSCGKKEMTEDEVPEEAEARAESKETVDAEERMEEAQADPVAAREGKLKSHELSMVKEAHGFLGELGTTNNFGDEHRMKSYHYHKCMEGIASVVNRAGTKSTPGSPEWAAEEAAEPEHQDRKMCKAASDFFLRMSREKAFGDPHRQEAMALQKAMDGMANADPSVDDEMAAGNEAVDDAGTEEAGAMDEKGTDDHEEMDYHKSLEERGRRLEELTKRLSTLKQLV